ncbi:cache domain-containing protein [Desulfopila aestuarii]|uniref:Double Cache domain-containing protein n=1 Tax=Desulfopila aestuarii DSM 18488 TaxID=1121416 RepID=A0A1M7Y686_9BACT|nr:cache domain-containing protein [Desulfopila aestuarii]SHO48175.1 hypothetical protein SAMN02745220_02173 [Desulfopila aestuarii DSM 18488]
MMKKALLVVCVLLFGFSVSYAEDENASPEDVYNLVLKAYDVVKALGEESFPAFNDPKGEFVYKDTYVLVQRCPSEMVAHPFALEKLRSVDLDKTYEWNKKLCDAGAQPGGGWTEYPWPKPGETEPSRKITFSILVEGTPYTVMAGVYSDTAKVEELNATLK